MSVAAQEALTLGRLLEERANLQAPLDGLASAFFAEIQPLLAAPWATAETDFVYPKTRGNRPADIGKRLAYGVALTRLAAQDPEVHRLVAELNNLIRPQSVLRNPQLAARVMTLMTARADS